MIQSVRRIPRRGWLGIGLVVVFLGGGMASGCIAIVKRIERPGVVVMSQRATVEDGWIRIDLDLDRPKDCASQATSFLRRKNLITGRQDILPIAVTNTTVTDASDGVQNITLWYPVPSHLDLSGGPWGYWGKAQDDCGILSIFIPFSPRDTPDIPLPIKQSDTFGMTAWPGDLFANQVAR